MGEVCLLLLQRRRNGDLILNKDRPFPPSLHGEPFPEDFYTWKKVSICSVGTQGRGDNQAWEPEAGWFCVSVKENVQQVLQSQDRLPQVWVLGGRVTYVLTYDLVFLSLGDLENQGTRQVQDKLLFPLRGSFSFFSFLLPLFLPVMAVNTLFWCKDIALDIFMVLPHILETLPSPCHHS